MTLLSLLALVTFFLLACVVTGCLIGGITRLLFRPPRGTPEERADLATELRGLRTAARALRRAAR